jgi:TonB-dependent starch-binding outer membrane protein SusC
MKSGYLLFFIFALLVFNPSFGQKPPKKLTITGVVLDANQQPVYDAMILIDNEKTNIVTDEKGAYKIKVNRKARIISVFTFRNGMSEAEIGGKTVINFSLKASTSSGTKEVKNQNEESVDLGYGTVKKKDLTMPVGKIDGTNKKYAAYQSIYDMIRGEFPGVQVTGKNILIQGASSLMLSTEPLFIVDGIPVSSIDDISPRIVKSIEVLKGPSASVYGSRGSNGVIMIYTRDVPEKKK